jgi:signal transduction histidine kinase
MSYRPPTDPSGDAPLERLGVLLDAALDLAGEHDLETVLARTVARAGQVADATYAALGVYDGESRITTFIHDGIDAATVAAIGDLPHGRGLLGETIGADAPTRVDDIASDPRSVGFPVNHPPMRTFLGVPVRSAGRRYGNLYVTNKRTAEAFDETDERLLSALAVFAGCAIDNSVLLRAERDRAETVADLAVARNAAALRRELLGQIIGAQEAERSRVARDLHDQIGQSLTSMLLALRIVENTPPGNAEFTQRAEELRELVTDTLDDVRQLAFDLRPTVLDDIGLVAGIERLVETFRARQGLTVTLDFGGLDDDERLPRETETVVYRIVQEALTNVSRHAGTTTARVEFLMSEGHVVVEVRDDGQGFDPEVVAGSLGLVGMAERAALIDATFDVKSTAGAGTTVRLEAPRG